MRGNLLVGTILFDVRIELFEFFTLVTSLILFLQVHLPLTLLNFS